jgi:hypothetical protein
VNEIGDWRDILVEFYPMQKASLSFLLDQEKEKKDLCSHNKEEQGKGPGLLALIIELK